MSRLPLPLRPRCTRRAPRRRRASPLLALALLLATLSGIAAPTAAHLSIIRQGPESRGAIEAGDYMGLGLAAGDFNGDGYDDIAMGAPGEDVNGEGADAGAVIIDFGSHFGITQVGAQLLTAGSLGQTGQAGAHFGQALAAGDFNHDGFDDLVIGAPLYDLAGHSNAGRFYVVYGSAGGLLASSVVFDESSAGGAIETGDEFGRSFAVGNFDGDASGIDDLAVGAPGEDNNAGAVAVNYMGGPLFGLTAGVATFFKQSTLGGINTPGDRFGESIAAGNLVGSSHDDLAIGAPYQGGSLFAALGAGWVVKGSGSAPTAGRAGPHPAYPAGAPPRRCRVSPGGASARRGAGWAGFTEGPGNEPAEPGDEFGTTIAFGRFDATGKGGFAVSAPYEDYEDNFPWGNVYLADIGMVHIIAPWRQAFGLTCKRSTTWDCEGNPVFSQRPFDKIT